MTDGVGRFAWERALRGVEGPTGVRLLVLLTLGTYMNSDGTNAAVSQATLAAATGQADRTVRQHLAAAVEEGWLERTRRGHRRGDGTPVTSVYRASLPARIRQLSEESTGTGSPVEEDLNRQETTSQPAREGTSTGAGVPPTKGFTYQEDSVCVANLAFSKLTIPKGMDTHAQEEELESKIEELVDEHGEQAVRDHLAKVGSFPFAGELIRALTRRLPARTKFDRNRDTLTNAINQRRPWEATTNAWDLDEHGNAIPIHSEHEVIER